VPKITTFLTYVDQAEAAVELYTSVFPNSRVVSESRYGDAGPGPAGTLMSANFELDGQPFMALNGGPSFSFAQGFSLYIEVETQDEIDYYWEKLSAPGTDGQCGWLVDPFGVSWQVIPRVLGELIGDPDPAKAGRAIQAMLAMTKLDIAQLQAAHRG
jgi:predicted 3-demethylubiquinone-9 3-methyltransferase (glyoxalase superfamily)